MLTLSRRFSSAALAAKRVPVFSSSKFTELHVPPGFHVECPERIGESITYLANSEHAEMKTVSSRGEALDIIKKVHDEEYVEEVRMACENGLRQLSAWDTDTFVSRNSFDCFVLAQSAWLDAIESFLQGTPCIQFKSPSWPSRS